MDAAFDVPDSTDWLNTPLSALSELENALHCQVCKEFYETPMITTCNHTFCSKCIRTSLSADGRCPACRTTDQASKLRNNWALQEVVSAFVAARPAALGVARKAQEEAEAPQRPAKRRRIIEADGNDVEEAEASRRTTRSRSRRIANSQGSQHNTIEISDSEDDEKRQPELQPDDGLVACPLGCGKRMKEEEVFGHLDRCDDEKMQTKGSRVPVNNLRISRLPLGQGAKLQDRINELNYSMMRENALSKKLKDIGIPCWGSKQLLVSRHREWVNIWNANCDSTAPRTKRELLHDLDVWERTQGGKAPAHTGLSSSIMRKDFDGDAYSRKHQDEFSRLIADAKRKRSNPSMEDPRPTEDRPLDETVKSSPAASSERPEGLPAEKISGLTLQKQEHRSSGLSDGDASAARKEISGSSDENQAYPIANEALDVSNTQLPDPSYLQEQRLEKDEHPIHTIVDPSSVIPASLQVSSATQDLVHVLPEHPYLDDDGGG